MAKILNLSLALSGLIYFNLLFVPITHAANEFSSSYEVTYSVNEDGAVDVVDRIKLKNLTDKFFPSSYTLVLPGSEISDLSATDSQGALEIQSSKENQSTKITVKFSNQQIIGLGKEYAWELKFRDHQIAKHLGKIWNINIPKITQQTPIENLNVTLSVPTSLGDPDFISHKPAKINESGGKVNLIFEDNELANSGLSAIFGQDLNFKFELSYFLKNNSIFPKYQKIAFPRNTAFQKAFIESIEPRPENTEIDGFGNSFATFKLNSGQQLNIKVSGHVQTFLNALNKENLGSRQEELFTGESKYWDINNPAIKTKLSEILAGKNFQNNNEKAFAIDKFVSNFLQFNYQRIGNNDFTRFGAVTALNNPEKALTSEFVDLEVALLRAAGIPARQVIGFALNDKESKPFAFSNNNLHSWLEFYEPNRGWVISDPAWENTTHGADFFAYNNLNHIALVIPLSKEDFSLPVSLKTEILEGEISQRQAADLNIQINEEILSGFPSSARIQINNTGNVIFPPGILQVDTSKILLEIEGDQPTSSKTLETPEIPPFGNLEYRFNIKTGAIWHSYQDIFQVNFAGVNDTRVVTIVPILSYKIFTIEIVGALAIILLFYILVLLVHFKSTKKH